MLTKIFSAMICCFSPHAFSKEDVAVFKLEKIRELNLEKALEAGRHAFISSASGIIKKDEHLYVIADDENSLFSFRIEDKYLKALSLLAPLPSDNNVRKKMKPDFESLLSLSKEEWPPLGAIVAWPSGSTIQRITALILPFKNKSEFDSSLKVNISALTNKMAEQLADGQSELNIEGILARDKKIFFFQRGNASKGKSGFFEISFKHWLQGMKENDWSGKIQFTPIKIGSLNGVKLSITDAVWTSQGLLAIAAAEDTISTFADGHVYGSVLVRITGKKADILGRFEPNVKIEGIAVESENADGIDLLLVDDADDPKKASSLYRVKLKNSQLVRIKPHK